MAGSDGRKSSIALGDTEGDMKQLVKLFESFEIIYLKIDSILLFHMSSLVCAYEIPWNIQQSAGIVWAIVIHGMFSEPEGEENN